MDLQDILSNPQIIEQLARTAGVGERDAQTGLEALLPAVTQGLKRNGSSSVGIEGLVKALGSGAHDRYIDHPEALGEAHTRADGNAILGHIFGSKQVSRNVAGHAAESTGLDSSILKTLLPIVASLAMGALSKSSQGGADLEQSARSGGGGADLLGSLLGSLAGSMSGARNPEDDSPLDDVLDLAKRFF